jgi:hypothetical protein
MSRTVIVILIYYHHKPIEIYASNQPTFEIAQDFKYLGTKATNTTIWIQVRNRITMCWI